MHFQDPLGLKTLMGRSIALLPFWRFDAKGGEVALVGLRGFARVRAQAYAFTIYLRLCPFILFVVIC